jgi:hypothetical protein
MTTIESTSTSKDVPLQEWVCSKHIEPIRPDGDGWRLTGSAIGAGYRRVITVFWYWERKVAEP